NRKPTGIRDSQTMASAGFDRVLFQELSGLGRPNNRTNRNGLREGVCISKSSFFELLDPCEIGPLTLKPDSSKTCTGLFIANAHRQRPSTCHHSRRTRPRSSHICSLAYSNRVRFTTTPTVDTCIWVNLCPSTIGSPAATWRSCWLSSSRPPTT